MIKFYDTSSLLLQPYTLDFDNPREIVGISSITLEEIENIKISNNKDADVKFAAARLSELLDEYYGKYYVEIYKEEYAKPILKQGITITNDTKIIACAINLNKLQHVKFITNDLNQKHIAKLFLNDVEAIKEEKDYDGYKEIVMNETEMADFYQNFYKNENTYNLLINEYLIIRDEENNLVDKYCWTGEGYRHLDYGSFTSPHLGEVKPMKNDIYQAMLADSFRNNKITLVKGSAGTGKSYMSLAFLLHQLSKGKISKIIIFCNTVATKDSAKLGFYPGTRDEKLLDSQIGNFLSSKLGDKLAVEQMIQQGTLVLLPMSDIRGYDTSGMNAGIYITEAQNLSINLMKLALQRIGEDSICIIDGDCKTQVDDVAFSGNNNGMKRVSKVFRNSDIYGEVTLKNIHRSEIGRLAEKM